MPRWGYVSKTALASVIDPTSAMPGATYTMTRSLEVGAEWGFRLAAGAAEPRTIRWGFYDGIVLVHDRALEGLRNDSVIDMYRMENSGDLCGRLYARFSQREMIEVTWNRPGNVPIEDARGASVEVQTLSVTPPPGTRYAPMFTCREGPCGDPITPDKHIVRLVNYLTMLATDSTGAGRSLVVRTEFNRN